FLFINWIHQFFSKKKERNSSYHWGILSWRICNCVFNICRNGSNPLVRKCLSFLYCFIFIWISFVRLFSEKITSEKLVSKAYRWDVWFLYWNCHSCFSC